MIKKVKKSIKVTINTKYCDICGKKIEMDLLCSAAVCKFCGKDLCEDCIGFEENDTGDYRTVTCKICWEAGKSYYEKIREYEKLIDELYDGWENKCKNNKEIS